MQIKILHLPLKAKWYKMIESGVKNEEYREIKQYWCDRLIGNCPYGREYWGIVLPKIFKTANEKTFQQVMRCTIYLFGIMVCAVTPTSNSPTATPNGL